MMASRFVDEEKGEAGFAVSTTTPISPNSSTGSTLFGRQSTSDTKTGNSQPAESPKSRSIASLLPWRRRDRKNHEPASAGSDLEDELELDEDDLEAGDDSIVRKIHEQPNGYPRLATFLDSDENFMLYRRFGYLQSRLLLERQDELRQLELKLDIMEAREVQSSPEALKSRTDISEPKKKLFTDIETKWMAYCQLLQSAAAMTGLNKPTAGEQCSVSNWMYNVECLSPIEANFIQRKEDLVTLRPGREHAWLDSSVEKTLKWIGWAPVRRAFQSKNTRAKSDGKDGTVLYTRSRIENFVVSIITLMILALLVVPIWVLYRLSEGGQVSSETSFECIGVLLVSTLAFSACISLFTRAKRHEILAASAAYCAVLVVFIGNIAQH